MRTQRAIAQYQRLEQQLSLQQRQASRNTGIAGGWSRSQGGYKVTVNGKTEVYRPLQDRALVSGETVVVGDGFVDFL